MGQSQLLELVGKGRAGDPRARETLVARTVGVLAAGGDLILRVRPKWREK